MSERRFAFRRVLAEASALGVSDDDIREVVNALAGHPELDPWLLRSALADYAPQEFEA